MFFRLCVFVALWGAAVPSHAGSVGRGEERNYTHAVLQLPLKCVVLLLRTAELLGRDAYIAERGQKYPTAAPRLIRTAFDPIDPRVRYLYPWETRAARIVYDTDLELWLWQGTGTPVEDGEYAVVMTGDGTIYVHPTATHPALSWSGFVASAGLARFRSGEWRTYTNETGHYYETFEGEAESNWLSLQQEMAARGAPVHTVHYKRFRARFWVTF